MIKYQGYWGVAKRPVSAEDNAQLPSRGRIRQAARRIKMTEGYVYLLLSDKDFKTYLGSTDNISRRTQQHFEGKVTSTKYRLPLRLIYTEEYSSLAEARGRERYLKTKKGRKELKKIFENLKK